MVRDPKIAILSQDKAVSKKACCKFNFLSWSKFDKKNKVPKIIVIIDAPKKKNLFQINKLSNYWYEHDTPRIIWKFQV